MRSLDLMMRVDYVLQSYHRLYGQSNWEHPRRQHFCFKDSHTSHSLRAESYLQHWNRKIIPTWPPTSTLQEWLWKSVHNSLCEATYTKLQYQGEANKQFKSGIQTVKLANQDTNWEERARLQWHLKTHFAIWIGISLLQAHICQQYWYFIHIFLNLRRKFRWMVGYY